MRLFNDVAKKVGTVAGEAGTKAKDLANITKLSVSVGAKEKEIEKLYIISSAVLSKSIFITNIAFHLRITLIQILCNGFVVYYCITFTFKLCQ